MFKLNIPILNNRIIQPGDLLPLAVINTKGEVKLFDAYKIIDSLIKETSLDKTTAEKVTTNVLRKLAASNLEQISAPHLRELVCGELTFQGLHKYRNLYTRLGLPIYDIERTFLTHSKEFISLWLTTQIVEQFVHLKHEINDKVQKLIDEINEDAIQALEIEERDLITSYISKVVEVSAYEL